MIDGEEKYTTLKDIKGANEIIARTGFAQDTPVGKMMKEIRAAYNGTNGLLITEEEKKLAESIPRVIRKEIFICFKCRKGKVRRAISKNEKIY
ncbi:MAG: hypothetical protein FWF46_04460 [Oscillospiraceae bacterium]|nr:hypothetical protein [Oscillospiraceae bacterium]